VKAEKSGTRFQWHRMEHPYPCPFFVQRAKETETKTSHCENSNEDREDEWKSSQRDISGLRSRMLDISRVCFGASKIDYRV
jgi:hypothetical protein